MYFQTYLVRLRWDKLVHGMMGCQQKQIFFMSFINLFLVIVFFSYKSLLWKSNIAQKITISWQNITHLHWLCIDNAQSSLVAIQHRNVGSPPFSLGQTSTHVCCRTHRLAVYGKNAAIGHWLVYQPINAVQTCRQIDVGTIDPVTQLNIVRGDGKFSMGDFGTKATRLDTLVALATD